MKNTINVIVNRWRAQMPDFFKWILGLGTGAASIAVAIQMSLTSAGATVPGWWETIFPYIVGLGAGMTATAKLTQKQ